MNKLINLKFLISALVILSLAGCSGKKTENKPEPVTTVKTRVVIGNETSLLLKDLEENGDYVNSQVYPSLIKASIVNESLDENILIIDLRTSKLFSEGHIKGAVNKKFEDLPGYFEAGIKPFEYDKIIMVSEDGQISSYTTSLLRLMGYGNVYSMRWGMSAWNNKYAKNGWFGGVSGSYETKLENKINVKAFLKGMPELNTGMTSGPEIGTSRFRNLFEEGTGNVLVTADEVFSNPQMYYIINLDRKDKYEDGHIPGAVRYKPDATLGFTDEMASIPFDKTVVVYCGTGHNSGFATAFLRLFGYDARTLKYGNNSFMYDKMVQQRTSLSWLPFTSQDVNNFKVVK
ncbi:MAG TPA: rhodanese-like domain-containing protein [Bacteroidales bacterium]|nr:rhodanese-like domain-containing protein [Bacteroidales bacterium]